MTRGSGLPGENVPEPPRTLSIVVACVVGVMAVGAMLILVNLLD